MTYRTEFPDFPPETMPAIPADWQDQSWHNDICPSFLTPENVEVWVDYADPAMREAGADGGRFVVQDRFDDGTLTELYSGDDWDCVLKALENLDAKIKEQSR